MGNNCLSKKKKNKLPSALYLYSKNKLFLFLHCTFLFCYILYISVRSNILWLYTKSVLLFLFGACPLFWLYTSERSELFPIIGIAALFIVFPSATVVNENPPFAKHNGRSVSKVLVYRIGFLDLTRKSFT